MILDNPRARAYLKRYFHLRILYGQSIIRVIPRARCVLTLMPWKHLQQLVKRARAKVFLDCEFDRADDIVVAGDSCVLDPYYILSRPSELTTKQILLHPIDEIIIDSRQGQISIINSKKQRCDLFLIYGQ